MTTEDLYKPPHVPTKEIHPNLFLSSNGRTYLTAEATKRIRDHNIRVCRAQSATRAERTS